MGAPDAVMRLVERFDTQVEDYKRGLYNETQVRRDFIDPFFEALGWDINNKAGHSERYREVIHEDSLRIKDKVSAPDYCFRIGSERKFFVEAKKPSVNVREDIGPAFQVRRYAWSAKLPLSILTDFEEFAVYDCRICPHPKDRSSEARVEYLKYTDYPEAWDRIHGLFSKEAILTGAFDRYAEDKKAKRGTAEVDAKFLTDLEDWRKRLATNIALRNPALSQRELNYVVQKTIDRIIFLRICEDRGSEPYNSLGGLQGTKDMYRQLCHKFQLADQKYNSGLFHFSDEKGRPGHRDTLSLEVQIDDAILNAILQGLYYPKSPYEFSILPVEILGHVYEQFLGSVIRLTKGHQAKVEEKPEVRKAGGVYYTPDYIVDYIVENTVGKLVEGKTPDQVRKIKIVDPACGSGSFLLGAYQYLLDWHLDYYLTQDPSKWMTGKNPRLIQISKTDYRLSTNEKKRILLDNIHGVDIDSQAVEVTKLSLLLKVMEGENEQTLATQHTLFQERALPDLGDNIKCGNSLIGTDFYSRGHDLSDDDYHRINAFDWEREFPNVFSAGENALWFVTFVTHNSRVSERMVKFAVKKGTPVAFTEEQQVAMARQIGECCQKHSIPVIAYNVLPDHVHMILAAKDDKELAEQVRKIKGSSSFSFKKNEGWEGEGGIWAQKFDARVIENETALTNAIRYIETNLDKHGAKWSEEEINEGLAQGDNNKGLKPLVTQEDQAPEQETVESKVLAASIKAITDKVCVSPQMARRRPGGFDAVIGNPPYVRQEMLGEFKPYFEDHYETYNGVADLYVYFIEKGIGLLKEGGEFGIIVANKWLRANYGKPLRDWLKQRNLQEIIDFGDLPVFQGATTYPCIVRVSGGEAQDKFEAVDVDTLKFDDLQEYIESKRYTVNQTTLDSSGWSLVSEQAQAIIEKMNQAGIPLGKYVDGKIYYGIKTGLNKAFVIDEETRARLIAEDPKSEELIKPFLAGRDIKRYQPPRSDKYLILIPKGWTNETSGKERNKWKWLESEHPSIADWLSPFKEAGEKRYDKGEYWWELRTCDYYPEFEKPKIMWPEIAQSARFAYDSDFQYANNKVFLVPSEDLYLLGTLNSKLIRLFIHSVCTDLQGDSFNFSSVFVQRTPIRVIDFSNPSDKARHDRVVEMVESLLEMHREIEGARTGGAREILERRIDAADREIDSIVYELYGLTDEEIALVEGA